MANFVNNSLSKNGLAIKSVLLVSILFSKIDIAIILVSVSLSLILSIAVGITGIIIKFGIFCKALSIQSCSLVASIILKPNGCNKSVKYFPMSLSNIKIVHG